MFVKRIKSSHRQDEEDLSHLCRSASVTGLSRTVLAVTLVLGWNFSFHTSADLVSVSFKMDSDLHFALVSESYQKTAQKFTLCTSAWYEQLQDLVIQVLHGRVKLC